MVLLLAFNSVLLQVFESRPTYKLLILYVSAVISVLYIHAVLGCFRRADMTFTVHMQTATLIHKFHIDLRFFCTY